MKISGIIPLRNASKLGYPFHLAIFSLRYLCDEIVVLVDPTSDDDTLAQIDKIRSVPWCAGDPASREMGSFVVVESPWDMTNHDGMNDEIAKQTAIAMQHATGDWIMSLQADEVLHENEIHRIRAVIERAEKWNFTALELRRWYFFGALTQYRDNWTVCLPRLVKRGAWIPDPKSGAMYFVPVNPADSERKARIIDAGIYHYSRVGDPSLIAKRVRNLDLFYHPPEKVADESEVAPYSFDLRKLDTYVVGHEPETDDGARLVTFPLSGHPKAALEYFQPPVRAWLYVARDGLMDFVLQNDSQGVVSLDFDAIKVTIQGREIPAPCDRIASTETVAPESSVGGIMLHPELPSDARDDDMVSVDFSGAVTLDGRQLSIEAIRVRVSSIKTRTCQ